ncbi:cytochrome P450 [Apodospora peruviana]|uniref:Cytochrome P450 n=1 Tax=Apodospora peruviana TaxID=516989 RepID=A0AAE0HXV2_9PEZI|nr:cytochrome P450 [Apodospora peruviana]
MGSTTFAGHWPVYIALYLVSWLGCIIIRRRYFHPLSHVPGPFLMSISSLPVFYYQGIQEGQLMHILPKLHAKYGRVVRISPNEVHLSDPEAYEKIHTVGTKFTKDPGLYTPMEGVMKTTTILTIMSNEEHKVRRSALNPFFSRRSVLDLEQIIWDKTAQLTGMLQAGLDSRQQIFDMHHAIRAFSVDVITEYAYARCWNQLDMPDFGMSYQDAIRAIHWFFPYILTFPPAVPLFGLIPDWLNVMLFPPFKKWFDSLTTVRAAVTKVRKEIDMGVKPSRRTIFHDLMEPPPLNETDGKKFRQVLSDETVFADAVNVTGAGAETTGSTAARAIFEVLCNPAIYGRLTKELRDAFPNPDTMTLPALEQLPLLNGVIKEALRLNPGLPGAIPRVVPPSGATFNGIPLPPGTVVSMSAWILHHDPDAFANPEVFDPYRWMDQPEKVRARERCMIPFGRGSRNCLGQNLAMAELYATVGSIFHRFDDLQVAPDFGREDLALVGLFLGYHPRKARKFKIVRREQGYKI